MSIALDRIELEPCARCQCVCFAMKHRLYAVRVTWAIIRSGHLTWSLDHFSNWPSRYLVHVSTRLYLRNWMVLIIFLFLSSFLHQLLATAMIGISKKNFFVWLALERSKLGLRQWNWHGWIKNFPNFPFAFVAKLYRHWGTNELG